jgi:thioesterase domain-containing protein
MMHAPVLVGYGSSECGPVTRNTISASKAGSVGTSFGPEIVVADPSGNRLPPNQEGEILLRGPGIISGYLDDEEANLQAFRNGWYCTGDLGRLDEDGFLFISGRLKEIINRGSEKILPGEIDRVLASHPDVEAAASFAIPHRTLGEDVAAAIVLRDSAHLTEADLRRYAATRLAAFKVPRLVVFVDSIPHTASGKPKRAFLADLYGTAAPRERAAGLHLTGVEQRVIGVWRRILGDSDISIHDDFIRLGGDSLSAVRMLAEIDDEFHTGGRVLARPDFFDQPTVGALVRILTECQADSDRAESTAPGILAFCQEGDGVPLFFLPGWRGRDGMAVDPYYPRHLAKSLGNRRPFYVVTASIPSLEAPAGSVEEVARKSLEAMRRVRPHGPYVLAGHCLGAVVAFEAAQQLIAEGETVPQLLLFDAVTPGYPKMVANWSKYAAELSRLVRHLDWREVWSHADSLARLLNQRVVGILRRAMHRRDQFRPRLDSGTSANARMLNNRRSIALWQYTPRGCPVPIVHFIAADQPVSMVLDDPRYGWRDFARSGIEIQSVPGDHDSMFSPENARGLAKRIPAYLMTAALVASAE